MEIVCPSCRMPVAEQDADRATGLAHCRVCNSRFAYRIAPGIGNVQAPGMTGEPSNVTLSESNGVLTIAWRWYSPKYRVTALFCMIWFALLALVYGVAIAQRSPFLLVLPLLHLGIGLLMAYGTLGGFLNTTTIRIDDRTMRVRHHPLPWPGNTDYSIAQVRQLYCQQTITRRRSGTYFSYDLRAVMADGTRKTVISGADTPDLPLYLERHAEAWMKIENAPVPGEMALP